MQECCYGHCYRFCWWGFLQHYVHVIDDVNDVAISVCIVENGVLVAATIQLVLLW